MSAKLKIQVSAPGKVILHGEHSVVYGKLAIAASLGLRTQVQLEETGRDIQIEFVNLNMKKSYKIEEIRNICNLDTFPALQLVTKSLEADQYNYHELESFVTDTLKLHNDETLRNNQYLSLQSFFYIYFGLMHLSNVPIEPISIRITTELSIGAGTGSSASLMVAITGALLQYLYLKDPTLKTITVTDVKKEESVEPNTFSMDDMGLISKWGFAAERIIHGNPSGIDNTICTFGSMVSFRKGRAPIMLKCNSTMRGIIVDTQVEKNTGVMVEKVTKLKLRHPQTVDSLLLALETIAADALEQILRLNEVTQQEKIDKCYETMGELAYLNHGILRSLGVSHPALESVINILSSHNLRGKLTGSGGGGYVVALIPPSTTQATIDQVIDVLTGQNYKPCVINLGGAGVQIDKL